MARAVRRASFDHPALSIAHWLVICLFLSGTHTYTHARTRTPKHIETAYHSLRLMRRVCKSGYAIRMQQCVGPKSQQKSNNVCLSGVSLSLHEMEITRFYSLLPLCPCAIAATAAAATGSTSTHMIVIYVLRIESSAHTQMMDVT